MPLDQLLTDVKQILNIQVRELTMKRRESYHFDSKKLKDGAKIILLYLDDHLTLLVRPKNADDNYNWSCVLNKQAISQYQNLQQCTASSR